MLLKCCISAFVNTRKLTAANRLFPRTYALVFALYVNGTRKEWKIGGGAEMVFLPLLGG